MIEDAQGTSKTHSEHQRGTLDMNSSCLSLRLVGSEAEYRVVTGCCLWCHTNCQTYVEESTAFGQRNRQQDDTTGEVVLGKQAGLC